jgi:hypothetical protein
MNDHELMLRQDRRLLRATLLRTARTVYAEQGRVTLENFHHVAGRTKWTLHQIREEATYLADCGYLLRHAAPRDALDREPPVDYALTAKGMRLLNGDMADESIEL